MRFKIIALILVACFAIYQVGALRWFDINFCGERIKEISGKWIFWESWENVKLINDQLDYSWMNQDGKLVFIAHALGASGMKGQNSLTEMQNSLSQGLRLMEVDIWLDDNGMLRCHHGPEQPEKIKLGDCTFEAALNLAIKSNAWLILDVKSDFKKTGDLLVEKIANSNHASRVVFQLYKPEDIEQFKKWREIKPFAGPILTLYLTRRSVNHVIEGIRSSGIRVLTIPIHRLPALNDRPRQVKIFTHPVHDCRVLKEVQKFHVDGFYITNTIVSDIKNGCPQ